MMRPAGSAGGPDGPEWAFRIFTAVVGIVFALVAALVLRGLWQLLHARP